MSDVKALIFDCFGVLYVGARQYIMSLCAEERRERMNELFDQADYGFLTTKEFTDQAAELLDMPSHEYEKLHSGQYVRDEAMLNLVREQRSHYKTALLTNANDTIIGRLFSQTELKDLFDEVIISSSVGMIKPQAELYEYTATKLGVLPRQCVIIDDLEYNIRGAEAADMPGIVFQSESQLRQQLASYA